MVDNLPKAKDGVSLNDLVPITLPAHIWLSFVGAYMSTPWNSDFASMITSAILGELMDPLWIKERQAASQQAIDSAQETMDRLTGKFPDIPPHMMPPLDGV